MLATINENPYIRYYQPSHHAPLGPLSNAPPSVNGALAAPPQQQQPAGQSLRWRSAMGGSSSSRPQEPVGEYLSRRIAAEVQTSLDEYMASNPDFPVR